MTANKLRRSAAFLYAAVAAAAVVFQLLLAVGVPLGDYAMGGAYPGRWPPSLRVAAVAQAVLIAATGGVIVSRAGLVLHSWSAASRKLAWGVVVFSALSLLLNLITPSAPERRIWAPVAAVMLVSSWMVARAGDRPPHPY